MVQSLTLHRRKAQSDSHPVQFSWITCAGRAIRPFCSRNHTFQATQGPRNSGSHIGLLVSEPTVWVPGVTHRLRHIDLFKIKMSLRAALPGGEKSSPPLGIPVLQPTDDDPSFRGPLCVCLAHVYKELRLQKLLRWVCYSGACV